MVNLFTAVAKLLIFLTPPCPCRKTASCLQPEEQLRVASSAPKSSIVKREIVDPRDHASIPLPPSSDDLTSIPSNLALIRLKQRVKVKSYPDELMVTSLSREDPPLSPTAQYLDDEDRILKPQPEQTVRIR